MYYSSLLAAASMTWSRQECVLCLPTSPSSPRWKKKHWFHRHARFVIRGPNMLCVCIYKIDHHTSTKLTESRAQSTQNVTSLLEVRRDRNCGAFWGAIRDICAFSRSRSSGGSGRVVHRQSARVREFLSELNAHTPATKI